MNIVENKKTNLAFVISIVVMLSGLIFYFIHEFVNAMVRFAYTAFVGIADLIAIFALIAIILALFLTKYEKFLWNLSIILGTGYILFYVFAHFFAPTFYGNTGGLLARFSASGLSFIGLLLILIFTILMIVIFSMRFKIKDDFPIYQKFSIILWLLFLGVFGLICYYGIRVASFTPLYPLFPIYTLGITFLPSILELIYLLFGSVLLILSFFIGIKKNILSLLVLLFGNVLAITYAIGSVNGAGFNFITANTALIIGNFLIIIGAIALVVCTYFILKIKYEKPVATAK